MARIDDHEPLDLEMTWGEDDDTPVPCTLPRPRVMDRYERRSWRTVFLSWIAVVVLTFAAGACTGNKLNDAEVRDLMLERQEAENKASAAANEATYWQSEATSATAAYEAVESDVASLTATLHQWQLQAQEASSTIATLKQQKATPKPKPTVPVRVSAQGAWSAAQVETTLREAAAHYGLDAAGTEWIVATGVRVAYRESTYQPGVVNGSGHAGLFQFNSAWGSLEQRTDPVWSCYRFVKVYADGGEAKVRQHWRATV